MNIGVIGVGIWGKNHVRIFSELVGQESVKVVDLDEQNLKFVREKYGVETTKEYKDLLRNPEIEAVSICTPSSTHYQICKESLLSGKDVFCEKPLALNSSHCRDLIKVSEREDRILMVGHIFRYHALTQRLRETIKSGTLGKIFFIQTERLGLRTPRSDCGVIFDFAIHDVDIGCFLTGYDYPEEVSATAASYLPYGVDDFGVVALKFPDDILTHIEVSWLSPRKIRDLTLVGKKKSIFADFITSTLQIYDIGIIPSYDSYSQFKLITREGPTRKFEVSGDEPLKVEIEHFLDCLNHRRRPITDGFVGLRAIEIIEAAYASVRKNKTVKMKKILQNR